MWSLVHHSRSINSTLFTNTNQFDSRMLVRRWHSLKYECTFLVYLKRRNGWKSKMISASWKEVSVSTRNKPQHKGIFMYFTHYYTRLLQPPHNCLQQTVTQHPQPRHMFHLSRWMGQTDRPETLLYCPLQAHRFSCFPLPVSVPSWLLSYIDLQRNTQ